MRLHELVPSPHWLLLAVVVAETQLGETADLIVQHGSEQETQLCLGRVAPLPKAEAYSALCTSIGALYRQQQTSASSLVSLKEESERMRTSNADLERENQDLKAQIDELKLQDAQRVEELKRQKMKREKEWQAAAKKFQAGVASRDAQWQATVNRVETTADKKFHTGISSRDAQWQSAVSRIKAGMESHLQETAQRLESEKKAEETQSSEAYRTLEMQSSQTIRRLESEKKALEKEAEEARKQKEAIEASTSAGTQSRRAILLALNREKEKIQEENKEVKALMEQIKALQTENAQLVQRCVAG